MARDYHLNLTLEEAQAHFDQFVAQRPARLEALIKAYRADSGGANDLDGSPDSLVPLWRWAMRRLKVYGPDRPELTEDSASLIQDIAYYFSDVILHSIPGIQLELCRSQV